MPEHVPPGRAGRLWLRTRLQATRRSAELLDRKRQLMRHELTRLEVARETTERAWRDACTDAELWGRRAIELGGISDVALAAADIDGQSLVELSWHNTMGVVHPDEPTVHLARLAPSAAASANAAIGPAAEAYRQALNSGAMHAATEASYQRLRSALLATERRLRAIERHRIPVLEDELARVDLRLDELEREERVVTRWAKSAPGRNS